MYIGTLDSSIYTNNSSGFPALTQILSVSNGGTGVSSSTGTVAVVLSTSPTLVTPTIGVATATSLTFPSAGGTGTATSDTQSYYEEGTFTPTILGGTIPGTQTYTTQKGTYTKIGGIVFFNIYIILASATGTGTVNILGLPFTPRSNSVLRAVIIGPTNMVIATSTSFAAQIGTVTYFQILGFISATGTTLFSSLAANQTLNIVLSGSYEV